MKTIILIASLLVSITSFAQTKVVAKKTTQYAMLCYHKSIQIKGYAVASLIGECDWDPAYNGMHLMLIAQPADPRLKGHKIELGNVRFVDVVENKKEQLQASIVRDTYDSDNDNFIQKKEVIYVRSVDADKGIFSVNVK